MSYFSQYHFSCNNNRQTIVIQGYILRGTFSKISEASQSLQGKQLTVFVAKDRIMGFGHKLNYRKLVSATDHVTAFQHLKLS